MSLGLVFERDGIIYAAVDSSQTSFEDPEFFVYSKLLWINKNMLMVCAGELRPLKILRDLAGNYSARLVSVSSAADYICDWLNKLGAKEDARSECLLCGYDADNQAQAFLIQRELGAESHKELADLHQIVAVGASALGVEVAGLRTAVAESLDAGRSPFKAMSDAIYATMDTTRALAPPVVHEMIRAKTIQRFA